MLAVGLRDSEVSFANRVCGVAAGLLWRAGAVVFLTPRQNAFRRLECRVAALRGIRRFPGSTNAIAGYCPSPRPDGSGFLSPEGVEIGICQTHVK
jgi:hypothetical protein